MRFAALEAVRGNGTHGGTGLVLTKPPAQSRLLLSAQFLNPSLHSSFSVLPVSASRCSTPKPPLHDKQMAPMRFCRGLVHGNVSWPHIALGLKTDANCRGEGIRCPIFSCVFVLPQSGLTLKKKKRPWHSVGPERTSENRYNNDSCSFKLKEVILDVFAAACQDCVSWITSALRG